VWDTSQSLLALRDHSPTEWGAFVIVNCLFLFFMFVIAPRLRKFLRELARADEEMRRRFAEYYGALAGPAILPRNLVPELIVGIWGYAGIMGLWALINPTLPLIALGIAMFTFLLWHREVVGRLLRKMIPKLSDRSAMPDPDLPASIKKT